MESMKTVAEWAGNMYDILTNADPEHVMQEIEMLLDAMNDAKRVECWQDRF